MDEKSIIDKLDEMLTELKNINSMLCPFCREQIIHKTHPNLNGKKDEVKAK